MKKTITKEQLRQLIKEEMINEGFLSRVALKLGIKGLKEHEKLLMAIGGILIGGLIAKNSHETFKGGFGFDLYLNNSIEQLLTDLKMIDAYNEIAQNLANVNDESLEDIFIMLVPTAFKSESSKFVNSMKSIFNTTIRQKFIQHAAESKTPRPASYRTATQTSQPGRFLRMIEAIGRVILDFIDKFNNRSNLPALSPKESFIMMLNEIIKSIKAAGKQSIGIPDDINDTNIDSVVRKVSRLLHPDFGEKTEEEKMIFQKFNEAYSNYKRWEREQNPVQFESINNNKITISELRQLIRSELRKQKL